MLLEYLLGNKCCTDSDIVYGLEACVNYNISTLAVPLSKLNIVSEVAIETGIKSAISALIDYPDPHLTLPIKLHSIIWAAKNGAHLVDIVLPVDKLIDNDYVGFSKEVGLLKKTALDSDILVRFIAEYELLSNKEKSELIQILLDFDIFELITGTGTFPDDLIDNMLFCQELLKANINPIFCGKILTKEHYKIVSEAKINNIRFKSVGILPQIFNKTGVYKDKNS